MRFSTEKCNVECNEISRFKEVRKRRRTHLSTTENKDLEKRYDATMSIEFEKNL